MFRSASRLKEGYWAKEFTGGRERFDQETALCIGPQANRKERQERVHRKKPIRLPGSIKHCPEDIAVAFSELGKFTIRAKARNCGDVRIMLENMLSGRNYVCVRSTGAPD